MDGFGKMAKKTTSIENGLRCGLPVNADEMLDETGFSKRPLTKLTETMRFDRQNAGQSDAKVNDKRRISADE